MGAIFYLPRISPKRRADSPSELLVGEKARGVVLYWDVAHSELLTGGCSKKTAPIGGVIFGVSSTGECTNLAPSISRPVEKSAFRVLRTIGRRRIRDDFLPRLTSGGCWDFLRICCDSAITNYKMMRRITADSMQCPRSVVIGAHFLAHILSLVVVVKCGGSEGTSTMDVCLERG